MLIYPIPTYSLNRCIVSSPDVFLSIPFGVCFSDFMLGLLLPLLLLLFLLSPTSLLFCFFASLLLRFF